MNNDFEKLPPTPIPANTNREILKKETQTEIHEMYFMTPDKVEIFAEYIIAQLPDDNLDQSSRDYFFNSLIEAIPYESYITVQVIDGRQHFDSAFINTVREELQESMRAMIDNNDHQSLSLNPSRKKIINQELRDMNAYIHSVVHTLEQGIPYNVINLW